MLHLTWFSEYKGEIKTLRFTQDPRRIGLGHYRDADGTMWDVNGIVGRRILARRTSDAPNYYSTATGTDTSGWHEWVPYDVEVVS